MLATNSQLIYDSKIKINEKIKIRFNFNYQTEFTLKMKINEVHKNKFLIEIELLARFKYFLWKIYKI